MKSHEEEHGKLLNIVVKVVSCASSSAASCRSFNSGWLMEPPIPGKESLRSLPKIVRVSHMSFEVEGSASLLSKSSKFLSKDLELKSVKRIPKGLILILSGIISSEGPSTGILASTSKVSLLQASAETLPSIAEQTGPSS